MSTTTNIWDTRLPPEYENVDWEEAGSQMPQTQLLSYACPNWIKQMMAQSDS